MSNKTAFDPFHPQKDREPVEGPDHSVEFDTEGLPSVTKNDIVHGGRPSRREPADKQPVL